MTKRPQIIKPKIPYRYLIFPLFFVLLRRGHKKNRGTYLSIRIYGGEFFLSLVKFRILNSSQVYSSRNDRYGIPACDIFEFDPKEESHFLLRKWYGKLENKNMLSSNFT